MRLFYHYRVIHPERLQDPEGCIIAANHISANDPPFIGAVIPKKINYLAKSELFRNAFFGRFLEKMGAIKIRRGKVDRIAIEIVEKRLQAGQVVLIFPEGTRKSDKVKAGVGKIALETGKNILPVYIKNSNRFHDCFLGKCRLYIVVGEFIRVDEFVADGSDKENYRQLADHTMKKIQELDNECQDS